MNAPVSGKMSLLAALLLGGIFAAAANVDAAAPWFRPGGVRPIPSRDRDLGRSGGARDREAETNRSRGLYRERRFINYLYQGFLNRQPSPDETRFWSDRLGREANPTELVQEFMDSDEFFVRETFRGVLGREPDAAGMEAYLRALQGGQSRADVVEALLASEEFRNRMR